MSESSPASPSAKRSRWKPRCGRGAWTSTSARTGSRTTCASPSPAAQKRGEPLDHVLLYGPPGLGKTTLATDPRQRDGRPDPHHLRPGHRAPRRPGGHPHQPRSRRRAVHRRGAPPAARRGGDPLPGDGGLRARPVDRQRGRARAASACNLPRFTLVGATTRYAMLSPPLRDRFGAVYRLDYYDQAAPGADRPALGRRPGRRDRRRGRQARSRGVRAARPASPTACCAACATTPR